MADVVQDRARPTELPTADMQVVRESTARPGRVKLTGEGGLLGRLTEIVARGALEGEMMTISAMASTTRACRDGGNFPNGHREDGAY